MRLEKMVKLALNEFDIYFFDMDSTLINAESIELLARMRGSEMEAYVRNVTDKAMELPEAERPTYSDILQLRLNLIKPTKAEVEQTAAYVAENRITDEAHSTIRELKRRGKQVFIVSGGIEQIIAAVAGKLGVTVWFGVRLGFDQGGRCEGFYWAPTAAENGKAEIAYAIRNMNEGKATIMIGDGMTDAAARQVVDCFAAYTGIRNRPAVVDRCDIAINSLTELLLPDKLIPVDMGIDMSEIAFDARSFA